VSDQSNILLIGADGYRQDALAQHCRMLDVPFAIVDAHTTKRIVGEDVEELLFEAAAAADGDVQKAQTGIIYIDEMIRSPEGPNPSITRE